MDNTHGNARRITRGEITELVMLRFRVTHEHITDGDIDAYDDKLADALSDLHARGVLFDMMRNIAGTYTSSRYPNREQMRRHILAEFRAEYRVEWRHEPDTSYDNLLAIAEYVCSSRDVVDISIDGVSVNLHALFDSVVPQMRAARGK